MRSWIAVLAVASACHKAPTTSSPAGDADALWALAPDGMTVGMVVTPRAITMLDHAWHDVRALVASAPELGALVAELDLDPGAVAKAELSELGVGPARGAAWFYAEGSGDAVAVVPVVDRDRWLAAMHGTKDGDTDHIKRMTCKPLDGFYVCATSTALVARIGKGKLRDQLAPVAARGDIEFVASGVPLIGHMLGVAGVVQLSRGTVVVRNAITGFPSDLAPYFDTSQRPRFDEGHTSGLLMVDLRPAMDVLPLDLQPIAKAITGPLMMTLNPSPSAFDARVPLADVAPVEALIAKVGQLDGVGGMTAKPIDGGWRLTVPNFAEPLDLWIENKTLRVGERGGPPPAAAAPPTQLGAEIAQGTWAVAMWGRGTAYAAAHLAPPALGELPPEARVAFRVIAMLAEAGLAARLDGTTLHAVAFVRTIWSNPDDVVAKLAAIKLEDVLTSRAGEQAKAIAAAAPSSPFAADLQSGVEGVMVPAGMLGVIAAIAIPAYLDSKKQPRRPEAPTQLARIEKAAKAYYAEAGGFPVGDAVTPAESCCKGPSAHCAPAPSAWTNSTVWSALGFAIDHPTLFQYAYHSDGKTFTAEAIGDLDCDGTAITYKLAGTVAGGTVSTQLTEPAPNTD